MLRLSLGEGANGDPEFWFGQLGETEYRRLWKEDGVLNILSLRYEISDDQVVVFETKVWGKIFSEGIDVGIISI